MPRLPSSLRPWLLSLLVLACAPAWLATARAEGQGLQALQAIRDAAVAALGADATAQAMVAPGLRLAACSQALVATGSGAATAEVRCPDTPGWRLFVPVRRKAPSRTRAPQGGAAPATAAATAGTAPAGSAAPAVTVKRGDPVVLRAAIGGIEIRMGGRALGPALAGGLVNVENESSHRIVRGRLGPDGTVEVVN